MTDSSLSITEIESSLFNLVISMCKVRETKMGKGWVEARNETADFLATVAAELRVLPEDLQHTRDAKISAFLDEVARNKN